MVTFLIILGGLIAFNFILLKFSIQSVETGNKKTKSKKVKTNAKISEPSKAADIPKAA